METTRIACFLLHFAVYSEFIAEDFLREAPLKSERGFKFLCRTAHSGRYEAAETWKTQCKPAPIPP